MTLHSDVMSVDRVPCLASVSQPFGPISTTHIENKSKHTLLNALYGQVDEYRKRGFVSTNIATENDAALRECSSDLAAIGVHMEQVGTAQHAAYTERKIRQIKERVRAHTSTLPYCTI
jgi:cob(I)alamin adenosyltransferase